MKKFFTFLAATLVVGSFAFASMATPAGLAYPSHYEDDLSFLLEQNSPEFSLTAEKLGVEVFHAIHAETALRSREFVLAGHQKLNPKLFKLVKYQLKPKRVYLARSHLHYHHRT